MVLDSSEEKMLADLKRKRGVIKASLTRARTFTSKFDVKKSAITLLEFRQEELPQINRKFDEVQCQIELIDVDNMEEAGQEREDFEAMYFSVRSEMQEIINMEKSHNSSLNCSSSSRDASGSHRVRLAPIELPKFDGNIQGWESFFDCYKAIVHNDDSYPPAQKFSYLRSTLSGQALDMIKGIPITEANYTVAIEKLLKRYDNKSLVIQSHIRGILDSPRVETASSKELQELQSVISCHVSALGALGQPTHYWDAWLVTIVLRKLDSSTNHEWQLRQVSTELPQYEELDRFLSSRCVAFESSEFAANDNASLANSAMSKRHGKNDFNPGKRSLVVSGDYNSCPCCAGNHRLYFCEKFKSLPINDRLSCVKKAALCFNCFSPRHLSNTCKSIYTCRECSRKHNTLLHAERTAVPVHNKEYPAREKAQANGEEEPSGSSSTKASLLTEVEQPHVFLATAIVHVKDRFGNKHQCRAVLDSGSQVNFISKRLTNLLRLPSKKASLPISGIGAKQTRAVACMELKIHSRVSEYQVELSCYILPNIVPDLSPCNVPKGGWNIPEDVLPRLADPAFHRKRAIDLLIGGGSFFDILGTERMKMGTGALCLQDTHFGWIVTGELDVTCLVGTHSIGENLEDSWSLLRNNEDEMYGRMSKGNKKSLEAQKAVDHFSATAKRNSEGRFVLRLPVKDKISELGDTFVMARNKFLNVERKLQRDEVLRLEYVKFMNEYLEMGHMQLIVEDSVPQRNFYLPHHAVVKASSLTTKVRVVFDASAKSSSGLSLNDVLLCGPSIQDDVFTILCRFRKHLYVITGDVEKMYRQVAVAEEDCDLQRIVWRPSPIEEMRSYRLLTVTYGTASASYMATQCLVSLAEENRDKYPKAAAAIQGDFYMDDLMTGCDEEEDCLKLHREINLVMDSARLPLRKWCASSEYLREQIGQGRNESLFVLEIGDDDVVKSLGLYWGPVMDEFQFNCLVTLRHDNLTKRTILSDLNRVFDPLGFVAPALIRGKIFLQQLWQMKSDWDSALPKEVQVKWRGFYEDLKELSSVRIPRSSRARSNQDIEMHGFCDASFAAYGACIYVRSKDEHGQWVSRILCSKSRVAPLKSTTIPRLELCGALLLAQLAAKVAESWGVSMKKFRLWTDSAVVLGWLNSQENRLKTYVVNRISRMKELTEPRQWNHVKTSENPADIISRGVSAQELVSSQMWWYGPIWLSLPEGQWIPICAQLTPESELPEQRPVHLALIAINPIKDFFCHYSSWSRLLRVVGWLSRFIKYVVSGRKPQTTKYLTVQEIRDAEIIVLQKVQEESFEQEITSLRKSKEIPHKSKLKSLNPSIRNKLLVVGGRLENAEIPEEQKRPIVLPADHRITRLIFEERHRVLLHCGPSTLLADIRRRYWPLRARLTARSVVKHCVDCVRASPRFQYPLMAPLPKERVFCTRPFTNTGVDFAVPLLIRSGIRGRPSKKAWVAIFVCFSTKAMHIEVVEDLTTSAFIAALRRFSSRRGKPSKLWSDNGTNFIGAKRELASYTKGIGSQLANEGIEWHFNPPSAPHFGGLWESSVKSAKHHLTRVLKEAHLTLGELQTLLCQIEACLNSRPLTPLSSDPTDVEPLTPAHFLIGGPITLPPEPDLGSEPIRGLRRWRLIQGLMQSFWTRWRNEYLPQLQIRGKWTTKSEPLEINDVVIVKEDNMAPTKWKMARVVQLHPGNDGHVRVVTIRFASGTESKRPSVKLCRLPVNEDERSVENHDFQRGEYVQADESAVA